MRTAFALVLLAAGLAAAAKVKFDNHRVVDVVARNEADIKWLSNLPEVTDGVHGVDVWSNDGVLVIGVNTIRFTPRGFAALRDLTDMSYTVVINDLQGNIDRIEALPNNFMDRIGASDPKDKWYYTWHSFDEIQTKMKQVAAQYPNIVKTIDNIGTSIENRTFGGISISGKNPKKRVALIGGTHAREWIAEGVVMWAVGALTEGYGVDPKITSIVDSLEILVVPVYNPDGYEYSRTTNRYWRKNRRHNSDGTYGVDQNRNWDANFGGQGSSHSPSSDTYCGKAAFSEPETAAVNAWLKSYGTEGITSMIDFHSHASLLLRPWAKSNNKCPDEKMMFDEGAKMVAAIKAVHGEVYENIRASELYVATGTAGDGAYQLGIKSAFVFELAGNDFVVPESDIQKQGEEIFEGLKVFFDAALLH